jgi:hypothetical protein
MNIDLYYNGIGSLKLRLAMSLIKSVLQFLTNPS